MRRFAGKSLSLTAASALALSATAVFAQEAPADETNDADIVVTATKRPENIQDVPMAVTAVSGTALERQGINDLNQLQKYVPGLRFVVANTPRNGGVFMRGIGQNGTNQGIEPSVGVFLDGVYLPIPGPLQSNLRDISTVEVLRGPQGTLYGRNTPVGAININTREPGQQMEASLTGSYGNYNDVQISGYVGGGLGENLAGRLSFWYGDRDGYETNLATGKDINSNSQYGVRGRLKWDPSSNLTVNLIGYYTRIKSLCCSPEQLDIPALATPGFIAGSAAIGTPLLNFVSGDHKVEEHSSGLTIMKIAGGSAKVDLDLGSVGTLTSITAYSWIEDDARDPGFAGLQRITLQRQGQLLHRKGWTQEARLASPGDQTFTYIAGLYYLNEDTDFASFLEIGPGADRLIPPAGLRLTVGDKYDSDFKQKSKSFAAFGQLGLNLGKLHVIGGLRYTKDTKDASAVVVTPATNSTAFRALINAGSSRLGLHRSEDRTTYSLTAKYDFTDHIMGYVTYGTGSKSGGFNGSPLAQTTPIEFNQETSDTIEAGVKSSFLDGRVVVNFDAYRMNLNGVQSGVLNPVGAGFIVGNAGKRRSQGFELEMMVRPSDSLTLRGSLAYLDAKYTDYTAGQCPTINPGIPVGTKAGTCNFNGLRPYQSPPLTASLAADYRRPIGGNLVGFAGADVTFTDEAYLVETLDPRSKQNGYALLNARVGLEAEGGRWRVSLFGRNLTDQAYYTATQLLVLNGVMSAGGFAAPTGFVGWYAPPRTYGIEASVKF